MTSTICSFSGSGSPAFLVGQTKSKDIILKSARPLDSNNQPIPRFWICFHTKSRIRLLFAHSTVVTQIPGTTRPVPLSAAARVASCVHPEQPEWVLQSVMTFHCLKPPALGPTWTLPTARSPGHQLQLRSRRPAVMTCDTWEDTAPQGGDVCTKLSLKKARAGDAGTGRAGRPGHRQSGQPVGREPGPERRAAARPGGQKGRAQLRLRPSRYRLSLRPGLHSGLCFPPG